MSLIWDIVFTGGPIPSWVLGWALGYALDGGEVEEGVLFEIE